MINKMKVRNKKERKKKGFTLIELVISLAIMAVIALIALPNFNSIKESSKIKADRQSAESIKRTVQLLIVDDTIKVEDSNVELKFDPKKKEFVDNTSNQKLTELTEALSYVNPPATKSDSKYEITIKDNGKNVVVKVENVEGTSTESTTK